MPHEEPHDPRAPVDPLREWYVNNIWGQRVDDDDTLFVVMSLQVFQAGLTWRMILKRATDLMLQLPNAERGGFRSTPG